MGKIASKKTVVDGIEFDSALEAEYFEHMKEQPDVLHITLQPSFTLIEPFYVTCGRCDSGKVTSTKTGNKVQCPTCSGTGKRKRKAMTYTADFAIHYRDGTEEIVDVKGYANERFNYIRKIFEWKYGQELIVVKKQKGEWVRK
ncbi:DUF1064 domain-containing protein [Salibacterium lacus]|uniref:DUF1064 domain-containing protein n=1 Tax=Salibacterium lacus TaxID=1898109 RepID=A0ABW5SZ97_9BACI